MARYLGWNLTQCPNDSDHLDVAALVRQRFGRGRRANSGRGVAPADPPQQQQPLLLRVGGAWSRHAQPRAGGGGGGAVGGGKRSVHFLESECEEDGSQAEEWDEDEEEGETDEDELVDDGIDITHTQAPAGFGWSGRGGGAHAHHCPQPMDSQDGMCECADLCCQHRLSAAHATAGFLS